MKQYPISDFIPQQAPFCFVDKLTDIDDTRAATTFAITEVTMLVENGELSSGGIMENVAQTAAARIGYFNKLNSETIRVGVIGSVKNLTIARHPKIGEQLTTEVVETLNFQDVTVVDAKVMVGAEVVATCQLNVALI